VVAVADSKSSASDNRGLDLARVIGLKKKTGAVGKRGTPSPLELISEVDANVLVELAPAGGLDGEPGLSRISRALNRGMHVVTANKMPLAVAYASLSAKAKRQRRALRYSACVGGGIPIFEFADACTASDSVVRIDGVLNATSNYILTKMEQDGADMKETLEEAQRAGFAEADPSLDIKGVDAACKIVILGNHVLRGNFSLKDVKEMNGIEEVTSARISEAKSRGKKIRMIASVDATPRVQLTEISRSDPLAVDGPTNAVKFRCKASGERYVGGTGAGGVTTSFAVLRDILAIETSGSRGD
jgi:homoserine dehydrogenase